VYIINEFQTSPDSLQRIELHWSAEDFSFYPETLLGWKIVTSYGTATIDTPLVLDSNYVVIDSTNTSGVFKLGETHDTIEIIAIHEHGESIVEYLFYPEYAPTPPPGASACHLVCSYYSLLGTEIIDDWYIDSTPTFCKPNDDYPGCVITGKVYAADSTPMPGALISVFQGYYFDEDVNPSDSCISDAGGIFEMDSLLPGPYRVIAKAQGLLPDTQQVYISRTQPGALNFYLSCVGIEETSVPKSSNRTIFASPNPFIQSTRFRVQGLEFREGESFDLKIYDLSGQLVRALKSESPFVIWDGKDSRGKSVPSGIYFLEARFPSISLTKKLVRLQ
jgi:hypothetical protein